MDTQSEQAPHTGSRIGNDRCNISHFREEKKSFLSLSCHHTSWWSAVVLKMPKIKTLKIGLPGDLLWSVKQRLRDYLLLAPQRWVEWYFLPHLVFVVSPWRDDLYYLGWEIKEELSHCDPGKACILQAPRISPWLRNCLAALQNVAMKLNSRGKKNKKSSL